VCSKIKYNTDAFLPFSSKPRMEFERERERERERELLLLFLFFLCVLHHPSIQVLELWFDVVVSMLKAAAFVSVCCAMDVDFN
jgi:hypothetical protein